MLATLKLVTLDVRPRADVGCHHTALSVFFRFHVSDFDRLLGFFFRFQIPDFNLFLGFFSLRHLFPFFVGLCFFSDTEEHLMAALNVFLWNQIVEANQFVSCALAPVNS